jgi:hypothetical protein
LSTKSSLGGCWDACPLIAIDGPGRLAPFEINFLCREMIKVCRKLSRPVMAPSTILFMRDVIRIRRPSVSNEQVHTDLQPTRFLRRNVKETMTYLTLVALMMLVLSPVLVPLVITGVHAIGNLRTA